MITPSSSTTTCCSKHRPGTCAFVPGRGRRRRKEVRGCAQGKLPGRGRGQPPSGGGWSNNSKSSSHWTYTRTSWIPS
ncbi:uncharacterized protein A4U43_C05F12890, partial [Asparagus officinalis]